MKINLLKQLEQQTFRAKSDLQKVITEMFLSIKRLIKSGHDRWSGGMFKLL